jgi:hypothetical protein
LHKKNIIASYTFEKNGLDFTIAESLDTDFTRSSIDGLCNFSCQVF